MSQVYYHHVQQTDPEVFQAIQNEIRRQHQGLELIASENFVSLAVLEALGSPLTNKYAEGYPAKRYYGGCEYVDVVENLAMERAKTLFQADFANVQPHSGAQANMAVYFSTLSPGDSFLAMSLSEGGHLTHGSAVNFSGKLYHPIPYGVRKQDHRIDMDAVASLAREHKPKLIMVGASAYPRKIDFASFREIADEIGAKLVVDMAHIAGLVAAGLHPNPTPLADFVTSTTHKTLRGPRGGFILCKSSEEKSIKSAVFPGMQGGPLMHVIAAKAVAFKEALHPEFKLYQQNIIDNTKTLAETLLSEGFSLVSGGTDNHLLLLDFRNSEITGKLAEESLEKAGITVNKNMVPFDERSPFVTSGVRIGTAALTTRGMKISEMKTVGKYISTVLKNIGNDTVIQNTKKAVNELCEHFPLYPTLFM